MSKHSYVRCWLHILWGTLHWEKLITPNAGRQISDFLYSYANEKQILMKQNFINADHVHTVVDLPTFLSIEDLLKYLKGGSSHWINLENIVAGKFSWGRGYAAFSISQSNLDKVVAYVSDQERYHVKKTFRQEYEQFIRRHDLVFYKED